MHSVSFVVIKRCYTLELKTSTKMVQFFGFWDSQKIVCWNVEIIYSANGYYYFVSIEIHQNLSVESIIKCKMSKEMHKLFSFHRKWISLQFFLVHLQNTVDTVVFCNKCEKRCLMCVYVLFV